MPHRSPGVFRIFRVPRASSRFFGSHDLKIGHAEFDRIWYITARPDSLAQRIFTAERRDQVIESVLRIGALAAPSIEITRETLIVRAGGVLRREPEILAMAQSAIDFVGYVFNLGPEEGIAWVMGGRLRARPLSRLRLLTGRGRSSATGAGPRSTRNAGSTSASAPRTPARESGSWPDRFRVTGHQRSRLTAMNVELLAKEGTPALFILFAIIVGVIALIVSIFRSNAHGATLRNVAQKLGGTFVEGGVFSESHLELKFGARSARVEFYGGIEE